MAPAGITYREHPIHPILAPFVKVLWSLESERAIYDAPRERILPDGCVEFVIHFRDPLRSRHGHATVVVQPRALVVGQMRRFLELEPAGRIGFVAVRFHVRGAYRFFRGPLSEAAGRDANLEDLWGKTACELAERVAAARDMAVRLRLVESALLDALRSNARRDPAVDRCLQLIEQADGRLNITELAPEIGVSQRHLNRRFQEAVGTSPKEFARTRRFLLAIRTLSSGRCRTLTDTAHACGYFDQAHFNHEFRDLAGMTPREFFTFPNLAY